MSNAFPVRKTKRHTKKKLVSSHEKYEYNFYSWQKKTLGVRRKLHSFISERLTGSTSELIAITAHKFWLSFPFILSASHYLGQTVDYIHRLYKRKRKKMKRIFFLLVSGRPPFSPGACQSFLALDRFLRLRLRLKQAEDAWPSIDIRSR